MTNNEKLPHCAICNKPVDRLDWWDDPFGQRRYFRAECHGAEQTVEVDFFWLKAEARGEISMGVAFTTKELAP